MSRAHSHLSALLVSVLAVPGAALAQSNSVLTLLPTEGRSLTVGEESAGALSTSDFTSADDYIMEAWELEGRAGQTVTVDLVSDEFDARLYVAGPGFAETLSDDDGGGGCNARLTVTFLENGTFRVVASSFAGQTGTYTLSVSEQPAPAPTYGCGQVNPEVLAAMPTDDRRLELGSLAAGVLGTSSQVVQEGRPGEAWQLMGSAGERLSIVLESDAFDAYLYLAGPGLGEVLTDDDGGGNRNSRIDVTLQADGPYIVVASAFSSGSFGPYTIRIEEPVDPNALPVVGTLEPGATVTGQLSTTDPYVVDGRSGQVWGIEGSAGQRVAIDLRSEAFDTYLYVLGPGLDEPISDDDGGDGTNSQITLTFPGTGTYRVVAAAFGSGASGAYSLVVSPR